MKKNYISALRAVSCIGVIYLHLLSVFEPVYRESVTVFADTASRASMRLMMWAVPCFVMSTGALLLQPDKEIGPKRIFGRYILRVAVSMLVFFPLYALADRLMEGGKVDTGVLLGGLRSIVTGESWPHVWYLYLLLGLYLTLPVYKAFAAKAKEGTVRYVLTVLFFFFSILPLIRFLDVTPAFYVHVLTIYPFYLLTGYAIDRGIVKIHPLIAVTGSLLGAGLTVFSVIWQANGAPDAVSTLLGYSSAPVVMMSVSLFSLFHSGENAFKKGGKLLPAIDGCSYGIYLVHLVYIRLLLKVFSFDPYHFAVPAPVVFFLGGIVILILSWIPVFLLKKIPGLRKIL